MATELAQQPSTALGQIKRYLSNDTIKQRFADMLGKRSSAFTNSLINVVRNSRALQDCTPDSIMSAAIIPATLNLSIEPTLGQSYIIPYGKMATFQIGYKGVIQLCIRSGKYKVIHCSEIYADEIKSYNPITGQVKFKDPSTYKLRYAEKNGENVVGHYAYFQLTTGFEKACYMTTAEVMAHARRFSQAYKRDLAKKTKTSPWSTDPIAMGNKTVLKRLLTKYGIMSVEMQDVLGKDEDFETAEESTRKRIDAEQGTEPIDANFENREPKAEEPAPKKAKKTKKKAGKKKGPEPKAKAKYVCSGKGKHEFNEPNKSPDGQAEICPVCFTQDIHLIDNKEKPAFMNDD